jgi:hypothetical protein
MAINMTNDPLALIPQQRNTPTLLAVMGCTMPALV